MPLTIKSPSFAHMEAIPARHTCEGEDRSPRLTITGVPQDARSLVLIVDDPDAPDPRAPKRTWVHWVLYDVPPATVGLDEGLTAPPAGARQGLNDWGRPGYGGPCPPIGMHRYFHKLYALDTVLGDLGPKATKKEVEAAMAGHILERAELVGTYQKSRR